MQINIKVLNIRDGDAIIIHLVKGAEQLVLLIDGGHACDAERIKAELDIFLKTAGKAGPDVVICSHFDTDHIKGLIPLTRSYGKTIQQFYIHRTSTVIENAESSLPSEDDLYVGADAIDMMDEDPELLIVLEGIRQEKELIGIIDHLGIPCREPVEGSWHRTDWAEIEIVGPSRAYYEELFPDHFDIATLAEDIAIEPTAATSVLADPCQALDAFERSRLTPANLNSAILKITGDEGIFLFTADAGIESFYRVTNHQQQLSKLFWLKVPHHGSANNINSKLIRLMSPQIAVVSGKRHISPFLLTCLRTHCPQVDSTAESGDLCYLFGKP